MNYSILFSFVVVLFFTACDGARIYETNLDTDEDNWKAQDTLKFEFEVEDNNIPYRLSYNVRYKNDYPFYNLFTKYIIKDSSGKVLTTPALPEDMYLFDVKTGKPYGTGLGDIYDHRISFLKEYKFPYAGKYKLQVLQYMRDQPLPGIVSFGVRVEKANQ
ncbi:MAG: gliding motility lipoprotein GldH [Cytophagaceae bacterium]|nr:gliding motility lipoprotein GldH [Cytophagaceae bacterium]